MLLILAITVVLNLSATTHDVPMATFTIVRDQAPWSITVELDQQDFTAALGQEPLTLASAERYLQHHTKWLVDGQAVTLSLCSLTLNHDHCLISGELSVHHGAPKTLEMTNTCLLAVEPSQSNVIYLYHGEEVRGFRLHQGRQQTMVNL